MAINIPFFFFKVVETREAFAAIHYCTHIVGASLVLDALHAVSWLHDDDDG